MKYPSRIEVLATLRQIRDELQGNAEDSVICQLDQAIQDLETAEREQAAESTSHYLLELLGSVLEKLPAILALYDLWQRQNG